MHVRDEEIHITSVPRVAVTVPIGADMVGVSPRTMRRMIDAGMIPYIRFNNMRLIPVEALQQWAREQTIWPDGRKDGDSVA